MAVAASAVTGSPWGYYPDAGGLEADGVLLEDNASMVNCGFTTASMWQLQTDMMYEHVMDKINVE
jgi:hypothetical protein